MRILKIVLRLTLGLSFLIAGNGVANTGGKVCAPMMVASQLSPTGSPDHACCCCGKQKAEQKQPCSDLKSRCVIDAQTSSPVSASSTQNPAFADSAGAVYLLSSSSKTQTAPKAVFVRETTYLINLNFLC